MSLSEIVLEGTLKPDGTLELDERPKLAPGRVTVVLRPREAAKPRQPLDDQFFRRMDEIWAASGLIGLPSLS